MENQELIVLGKRNKSQLSQEALAHKCDFNRTYISLLKRGKLNPSYLNLLKLIKGLEISLSQLFKIDTTFESRFNNRGKTSIICIFISSHHTPG